jgi:hypothetical protein
MNVGNYSSQIHNIVLRTSVRIFMNASRYSGWMAEDFGVRVQVGSGIFSLRRPDRLWAPPSLPSNGYRGLFPRE